MLTEALFAMPTYGYRCDACGHQFEAFQKFSEDPLRVCPACGESIRRVIHPVGVVFKGSGWYITDSRPKSTEGTAASDKPDKTEKTDKKDKTDGTEKSEKKESVAEATPAKASKPTDAAAD
jgi:putative FmdB family regulatory protein